MNCLTCGHIEFDNFIRTCCPSCTSENITVVSDEPIGGDNETERDIEMDLESEEA